MIEFVFASEQPDCPEVTSSAVGLVPTKNALVATKRPGFTSLPRATFFIPIYPNKLLLGQFWHTER